MSEWFHAKETAKSMWWVVFIMFPVSMVAYLHGGVRFPIAIAYSLISVISGVLWVMGREFFNARAREQRRKRKAQGGKVIEEWEIELQIGGQINIEEIDKDEMTKTLALS